MRLCLMTIADKKNPNIVLFQRIKAQKRFPGRFRLRHHGLVDCADRRAGSDQFFRTGLGDENDHQHVDPGCPGGPRDGLGL